MSQKIFPDTPGTLTKRDSEAKIDLLLESQFAAGRLYAAISSRPGQSGRADGYILEGKELEVSQLLFPAKRRILSDMSSSTSGRSGRASRSMHTQHKAIFVELLRCITLSTLAPRVEALWTLVARRADTDLGVGKTSSYDLEYPYPFPSAFIVCDYVRIPCCVAMHAIHRSSCTIIRETSDFDYRRMRFALPVMSLAK